MDSWIPVASHQMASPSLPIVSLQRCENEQLQSSKPETNRDLKGGNNSPLKQQVHCSRGRDNTTRTDTAGLCNSAARDGWGYLPMSIPCRPMRLPNLVRSGGKRAHCGPHCQDGAWLFFVTLRAFSQVGETVDIGNHRPSDNQIRYPPDSGAANPDSTPFSALTTAAPGTPGTPELQKSIAFKEITQKSPGFWVQSPSSPRFLRSAQLKDQRQDWAHLVP